MAQASDVRNSSAWSRRASWILLGIFMLQGWVLAWRTGVTYDEPPYIAAGHIFVAAEPGPWVREYPPLLSYLRGLALLPLSPSFPRAAGRGDRVVDQHGYGQLFLFSNRVPPKKLLQAARAVSLALALLLAIAVWSWGNALGGDGTAAAGLFFLAFEPNLLAHGSLATTDIGTAAFTAVALAAWAAFLKRRSPLRLGASGAAVGACVASKATGLGLLPAMGLALLWARAKPRAGAKGDLMALAVVVAVAAAVALGFYAFTGVGGFFTMLSFRGRLMSDANPVFLFGSVHPRGHPLYFPIVLLLKTTLPLLVLTLYAAVSSRLWRRHPVDWRVIASAVAVILAAAMLGRRQSGVRYVLMFYPLFCLAAGAAAADLWGRATRLRPLLVIACVWHAASSLAAFPHPLAYLNELAGGPAHGYRVLGDSNLDWGQGVPELKAFLKKNPGGLILSYFGRDCPREWGVAYQDALSTAGECPGSSALLPVDLGREWLAVSATKWQGFYETGPPVWGWLRSRKPLVALGYALLVYDVTSDVQSHRELAAMYTRAGETAAAKRETRRADRLLGLKPSQ